MGDLGASGGDLGSVLGCLGVYSGWIWGRCELFLCVFDFFWSSRFDAKKRATSVPNVFSKTQFLERRPSEDLRSSLPLSALPVLARKGFVFPYFSLLALIFCYF